jgi:hypothetical protein
MYVPVGKLYGAARKVIIITVIVIIIIIIIIMRKSSYDVNSNLLSSGITAVLTSFHEEPSSPYQRGLIVFDT